MYISEKKKKKLCLSLIIIYRTLFLSVSLTKAKAGWELAEKQREIHWNRLHSVARGLCVGIFSLSAIFLSLPAQIHP